MAKVVFSSFIQHYVNCPPMEACGSSVREVLDAYFQEHPQVRSYILDERDYIRPRLAVLVDNVPIEDRVGLSDPVHLSAQVFVLTLQIDDEYETL
jgi:sulfur-carrier protein